MSAHYPLSAYSSPELQWSAVETDGGRLNLSACKLRHVANILATQTPVYTYEFRDQTAPSYWPPLPGFKFLAYHTGDIQYYWLLYHGGRLGQSHPLNGAQQRLADALVNAWQILRKPATQMGRGRSRGRVIRRTDFISTKILAVFQRSTMRNSRRRTNATFGTR